MDADYVHVMQGRRVHAPDVPAAGIGSDLRVQVFYADWVLQLAHIAKLPVLVAYSWRSLYRERKRRTVSQVGIMICPYSGMCRRADLCNHAKEHTRNDECTGPCDYIRGDDGECSDGCVDARLIMPYESVDCPRTGKAERMYVCGKCTHFKGIYWLPHGAMQLCGYKKEEHDSLGGLTRTGGNDMDTGKPKRAELILTLHFEGIDNEELSACCDQLDELRKKIEKDVGSISIGRHYVYMEEDICV